MLGNYIGTDVSGTFAVPNAVGLSVNFANTVGGTAPGSGNLISGNTNLGLGLGAGALAQGNFIGTDWSGLHALGNGTGVFMGDHATLGGTTSAARNIVSGNLTDGVLVADGGNVVQGNYIGTDITGTAALGNGDGDNGVYAYGWQQRSDRWKRHRQ